MSKVVDLKNGFAVEDRSGRREYSDDQVVGLSLYHKRKFKEGRLRSRDRFLLIWVEGEEKPIKCVDEVKVARTDKLESLVNRLSQNYAQRSSAAIDAGAVVNGDGFILDKTSLTVGKPGKQEVIPIDELSAMEDIDERLRIWCAGKDEPVLKLPFSAKNVHVLQLLLADRIPERPAVRHESPSGLGRVLFEREASITVHVCLWLVVAIAYYLHYQADNYVSLTIFLVAGLLGLYSIYLMFYSFKCHEYGVHRKSILGNKILRFNQLESFRHEATNVYMNGAYQWTRVKLKLKPKADSGLAVLTYQDRIGKQDTELEAYCGYIAANIAEEMSRKLQEEDQVVWTKRLTIRADGLVYRPTGLLGGAKDPVLIPYKAILKYDVDDGHFRLWVKSQPKTVTIYEPCSDENFFPGYELFKQIVPR